ncbi:hypothetical protein Ferp_0452 [Ferroglobus placidus DSM 10642]|uniref:TraC-like domain-containing protein n=2 Tax=Ferroglobus placidus TaxID=54261 RepID=D3S2Z4_FERPA|nr:hypothetical protein Ferp_0452 [Ferroglobus placidus DSM 10642]
MQGTGLRVVEFPSVVQAESKLFGLFTPVEILTLFLISSSVWILLRGFGVVSVAVAAGVFAFLVFMKAMMPEEVGYMFPLYEARFAARKKAVYAHELDTTKYLPSTDFVDGWVMRMKDGYGAIIEVQPVNFFYSTPADQRAFLDSFKSTLDSLDFPIQILSIAAEFNAGRYLNRLMLRLKDEDIAANPILSELAHAYLAGLDEDVRTAIMRRYFVVVTVPKKTEEVAIGELKRRVETVASGLRRGGIPAKLLEREDILALYELIANRTTMPKNYNSAKVVVGG